MRMQQDREAYRFLVREADPMAADNKGVMSTKPVKARPGEPYRPSECCFAFVTHPIPRVRISHYYETSSQCAMPGVIFTTKRNHSFCANPNDDWVQDYIKDLKKNLKRCQGPALHRLFRGSTSPQSGQSPVNLAAGEQMTSGKKDAQLSPGAV
ncbi:PREDICTED: c-C motif chemokine 14 [Chrysochloris asiatica]|uniref:C-C motif chemokine n=1 Tax=Chrysochloris asiatica TaxID=185453 RepID=A0A9B0T425_CHRAS|nr:PREDICTED: c-C motif chemokine 14 [Chrysochloris asiatica]